MQPVLSHAGQHAGEHPVAEHGGGGPEQHVDRRPTAVLAWVLVGDDNRPAAAVRDNKVEVTGSDHDQTGLEAHAGLALDHGERGRPVHPLGEQPREDRGHVLDDHDRDRQVAGERADDRHHRVGTADRGANDEELVGAGPGRPPVRQGRWSGLRRSGLPWDQRLDPGNQLGPDGLQRRAGTNGVARLGDVVAGAEGERLERGRGRPFRQRAEHDHRQARVQPAQVP
jgi:hypothetical protein